MMYNFQGSVFFWRIHGASWNLFNCRCPLANTPSNHLGIDIQVLQRTVARPLCTAGRDQNVKLSVEETRPDPRYVLLQNEEYQGRLLPSEIQANHSVGFTDAFAICLMQCLRVFRCCHRHCSDRNVPLSVEESEWEPCSVRPWFVNEDDGGMILDCVQQSS